MARVSVIIPYYNHGRHLHQTVSSVLAAARCTLEVLIVDDGAREPKAGLYLAQAQALSPAVRVLRKPNGGLSSARNFGLDAATGDFIQLLDSDDMLTPGKIDLQLAMLALDPDATVALSNYAICDETATRFERDGDSMTRFSFEIGDFLHFWERGFSIPIHCALFRRAAFEGLRFDTSVVGKEDWIFWCQLADRGARFSYLPVEAAIYRQHGDGMSKSMVAMGQSWLSAATRISETITHRSDTFLDDSIAWYRRFYESAERFAAPQAGPARARVPALARVEESDPHAWIAALPPPTCGPDGPDVSVVIPVFNHKDRLPACIASALSQEGVSVEAVIVDDCSSDPGVLPMLRALASARPDVTLIAQPDNRGISHAQNAAAHAARGRLLAFLDCDDALAPDALVQVTARMRTGVGYAFTDRIDVDAQGAVLRTAVYGGYPQIRPGGPIGDDLLDGMVASHLKVIDRAAYLAAGGCDPAFDGVQDWELALRLHDGGTLFQYVPAAVYRHTIHEASVTSSSAVRQFWLSNVVRRRHAARRAAQRPDDAAARARAREVCRAIEEGRAPPRSAHVIGRLWDWADVRALKAAWMAGRTCLFAPEDAEDFASLNLAREFNSYLDGILVGQERLACAFTGYLWAPDLVRVRGGGFEPTQVDYRLEAAL